MDEHLHMNSTAYNSDEHNTNSNNNNVNGSVIQLRTREIECAFCKRKGDQSTFCGQFCNRVCLGRHSQKLVWLFVVVFVCYCGVKYVSRVFLVYKQKPINKQILFDNKEEERK